MTTTMNQQTTDMEAIKASLDAVILEASLDSRLYSTGKVYGSKERFEQLKNITKESK